MSEFANKGPNHKKQVKENSLQNLRQNKSPKTRGPSKFTSSFKKDLYDYWVKKVHGEPGTTQGQKIIKKAAEESPMSFLKMASSLIPKEVHQENTMKLDFADTLTQLQKRVGSGEVEVQDAEYEDLTVENEPLFPDEEKLPIEEDKD